MSANDNLAQFSKKIWGQSGQLVSLQMGSFWWLLNLQIRMFMKPTKTIKRGKKLISLVKYRECHLSPDDETLYVGVWDRT